jgi:hypothetical protein
LSNKRRQQSADLHLTVPAGNWLSSSAGSRTRRLTNLLPKGTVHSGCCNPMQHKSQNFETTEAPQCTVSARSRSQAPCRVSLQETIVTCPLQELSRLQNVATQNGKGHETQRSWSRHHAAFGCKPLGSVAAVGLEAPYCRRKRKLLRNGIGFPTVGVGPQANFSGRTPNHILKTACCSY